MIKFHAVMIDETGCEFGAEVFANTRNEAYKILEENYPESRVDQLESPDDTRSRNRIMYARIQQSYEDGYEYDNEDC